MALESKNISREEKKDKEFEERVIHIGRVSKTVKYHRSGWAVPLQV